MFGLGGCECAARRKDPVHLLSPGPVSTNNNQSQRGQPRKFATRGEICSWAWSDSDPFGAIGNRLDCFSSQWGVCLPEIWEFVLSIGHGIGGGGPLGTPGLVRWRFTARTYHLERGTADAFDSVFQSCLSVWAGLLIRPCPIWISNSRDLVL